MNSLWTKTLVLAAATAMYSHAIFGIGGQWAPSPGLEVKGSTAKIAENGTDSISILQGSVSGLQGFGFKLWVDMLPFIDIEASTNIQWGFYDVSLLIPGEDDLDLNFDLGIPTVDKPAFARVVSDVSVLYPFLKLPPVVSLVKLYAGGGLTHVIASEVLNGDFAKKAVNAALAEDANSADTPDEVRGILQDAIIDEGLKSGVGFHLMLGAKAKPPIIPIAVFANLKYHFLSTMPSVVDGNSLTMELGGALAF